MPIRVAGADPGTSSLDLLVLEDGKVGDQCRFTSDELKHDPVSPVRWLERRAPFDLIAGPSGYGLPLIRASECTERDLALMTLTRPDERGDAQGVLGFSTLLRALRASSLPVVFLPGVVHLPTVPSHRKINRIDLGTPDKLSVVALALERRWNARKAADHRDCFCLIELGSAFTACVVLDAGQVVDGAGGTSGAFGWRSGGAWDGELAYLLSPLRKDDLFAGGVRSQADVEAAGRCFQESLIKTVAGLQAVTPFKDLILSGRLIEVEPARVQSVAIELSRLGMVSYLSTLPGAWVKHAAQGAALIADGLAGGTHAPLVERLRLAEARGTVLDGLHDPGRVAQAFLPDS